MEAWRRAQGPGLGSLWTLDKTGVKCPTCGGQFVIVQRWTIAATVLVLLGNIACAFIGYVRIGDDRLSSLPHWQMYVVNLLAISPFVLFAMLGAPRLLRVRPLGEREVVKFPLDGDKAVASNHWRGP
jgi:hypothetical protein